jgi:hypothetical protein
LAAGELTTAARLGLRHWRVSWYLAEAARSLGHRPLEEQAMRTVREQRPALAANTEGGAEGLPG